MDTTIWKSDLAMKDAQTIEMPGGAEILSVGVQHGKPRIWARVQPGLPTERRTILVRGTGHPMNGGGAFLGTFQLHGGTLIFHVFDATEVVN